MKYLICLALFLNSYCGMTQDLRISGTLIHGTSLLPVPAAHIVNLNKQKGTISTQEGYFSMMVAINDTLHITALGFADLYLPVTEELISTTRNLRVELHPVVYELAEINLTPNGPGKFQRDFEKVPIRDEEAPLPGRPSAREVAANPPPPELANVFDLMYNEFGNKPRQLREVQELRKQDLYQEWISSLITTRVMNDYLLLPEEHHDDFLYFYTLQAFHPLEKEYQVYLSAKESLPYFFNTMHRNK